MRLSFLLGDFTGLNLPPSPNPLNYFSLSINNQNVPLVVTSENGHVLTVAGDVNPSTLDIDPFANISDYIDARLSPQPVHPFFGGVLVST